MFGILPKILRKYSNREPQAPITSYIHTFMLIHSQLTELCKNVEHVTLAIKLGQLARKLIESIYWKEKLKKGQENFYFANFLGCYSKLINKIEGLLKNPSNKSWKLEWKLFLKQLQNRTCFYFQKQVFTTFEQ